MSRLFLRWSGANVYSQTGWGAMAGLALPLDSPLRSERVGRPITGDVADERSLTGGRCRTAASRWGIRSRAMQGRPCIPQRHWCISPLFQISPYIRIFLRLRGKCLQMLPFSKDLSLPLFSKIFLHSPSVSEKLQLPLLLTISSCFRSINYCLFCLLYVFFFPLFWPWCIYASYNTCTGRLWSHAPTS